MIIFTIEMKKEREYIGELIRFGIVGCIAVVIQYVIYSVIVQFFSHNIAYTIGYLVSLAVNYWLTTRFTFNTSRSYVNGFGFVFCHVINYFMQIGLLNLFLYWGCSKLFAPIPVYIICVPTNFLLVRFVMKYSNK